VYLDIIKVFYLPTDAQVNSLKNNFKICIKIDIKTAPTRFGAITIIRERINFDTMLLLVHTAPTIYLPGIENKYDYLLTAAAQSYKANTKVSVTEWQTLTNDRKTLTDATNQVVKTV
jgi:hypothetical protein